MSLYRVVFAAIDLSEDSELVLDKSVAFARDEGAYLHLVHVLRPISYAYPSALTLGFVNAATNGLMHDAEKSSEDRLDALGDQYSIPEDHRHFLVGHPVSEILRLARDLKPELIVMGSRNARKGLLYLGTTSNGLMQTSTTDILLVNL